MHQTGRKESGGHIASALFFGFLLSGTLKSDTTKKANHPTTTRYVLIPGTWAKRETWYRATGYAKTVLESHSHGKCKFLHTEWSCRNSHQERVVAAAKLANALLKYQDKKIVIIAHSHGGNVAALLSQILVLTGSPVKIEVMFTLGTPIDVKDYLPNMAAIKTVVNLFSFGDRVQPVLGIFERTYPPGENIFNFSVTIDNREPNHSDLRGKEVIAAIPEILTTITDNQKRRDLPQFGEIKILSGGDKVEIRSNKLLAEHLEQDRRNMRQILNSLPRLRAYKGPQTSIRNPPSTPWSVKNNFQWFKKYTLSTFYRFTRPMHSNAREKLLDTSNRIFIRINQSTAAPSA